MLAAAPVLLMNVEDNAAPAEADGSVTLLTAITSVPVGAVPSGDTAPATAVVRSDKVTKSELVADCSPPLPPGVGRRGNFQD